MNIEQVRPKMTVYVDRLVSVAGSMIRHRVRRPIQVASVDLERRIAWFTEENRSLEILATERDMGRWHRTAAQS